MGKTEVVPPAPTWTEEGGLAAGQSGQRGPRSLLPGVEEGVRFHLSQQRVRRHAQRVMGRWGSPRGQLVLHVRVALPCHRQGPAQYSVTKGAGPTHGFDLGLVEIEGSRTVRTSRDRLSSWRVSGSGVTCGESVEAAFFKTAVSL